MRQCCFTDCVVGVCMCVCRGYKDNQLKKCFQFHAAKAEIVDTDRIINADPLPWDFRIMHNESKISILKYLHTWLKILIICGVLRSDCLLCTLLLLRQTEQLLYRIRMALLPEWHLSP